MFRHRPDRRSTHLDVPLRSIDSIPINAPGITIAFLIQPNLVHASVKASNPSVLVCARIDETNSVLGECLHGCSNCRVGDATRRRVCDKKRHRL